MLASSFIKLLISKTLWLRKIIKLRVKNSFKTYKNFRKTFTFKTSKTID